MKGCIINYDKISLKEIFDDIESFDKYNLLITNMECYPLDEKMSEMFSNEYCWIEGKELLQLLKKEEFQWIWGVFSVFSKEITLEEVLKYKYPYADGYSGFWENPITIQHPLATTEIVAWDGSKVLVISKKEELANTLLQKNVSAKDLEEYNQS